MRSSPTSRLDTWKAAAPGCPYLLDRMDEEWEKRGWFETPNCKKKPSDYIKGGNVYIHAEPGEELIPEVIRVMGRNRLFYASDWPHWDNEYPDSLYHIYGSGKTSRKSRSAASSGTTPQRCTALITAARSLS